MIIKILGTGCTNCKTLEKYTRQAVSELGNVAEVIKVDDITKILEYKILSTPALVINEKVVMNGKVPAIEEIKEFIKLAALAE